MDAAFGGFLRSGPGVDGAVLVADLVGVAVPGSVGRYEAVVVERRVTRILAVVVPAECEDVVRAVLFSVGRFVESLIHEIPDASALEGRELADQIPVFLESAHRVAHRVGIFTHDERTVLVVLDVFLGVGVADVHRAEDVGVAVPVGSALTLLVLDGTGRVERLGEIVGVEEVLPVAGLVAKAPDDDGRMVAVSAHHPFDTVCYLLVVQRVLGDCAIPVAESVSLVVRFVDDIEAIFIAQLVPVRVVRVVAGAHRVDVQLLHYPDVAEHVLLGDDVGSVRVHLVAVHAFDEDRLPVDIEQFAIDPDSAETRRQTRRSTGFPPVCGVDLYIVEVRCLRAPKTYIVKVRRTLKDLQAILDGGRLAQCH